MNRTGQTLVVLVMVLISTAARAALKPQAEAIGKSKPVEIMLRVYKKKVKVGDYPWIQIALRNIGSEPFWVVDKIFSDPHELRRSIMHRYGIYVEVKGPDGKNLGLGMLRNVWSPSDSESVSSGLLSVRGPNEEKQVQEWRRQGLSDHEINLKIIALNSKKQDHESETPQQSSELEPGQSVSTKRWYVYTQDDETRHEPKPTPVDDYMRLEFFDFNKPGKYMIRGVYDHRVSDKLIKEQGLRRHDEDTLARTNWVALEVVP